MRRRGGGSGAGALNRVDAQAARRFLLSIFDGAMEGRERGKGHDGAGKGCGKGGGRAAFTSAPRAGEWPCICGFPSNRPYREACHACGRPRAAAEAVHTSGGNGKGGGSRGATGGKGCKGGRAGTVSEGTRWGGGPVGADGTRPLLGGRGHQPLGEAAGKRGGKGLAGGMGGTVSGPSWPTLSGGAAAANMPGASGSAWELGKGRMREGVSVGGSGKHGKGKGSTVWTKPNPVVDSDGYELVQPRRVRATGDRSHENAGGEETAPTDMRDDATTHATARRLWSDDISDDGGLVDDAEGGDGEERGEEGGADWQADPRQLRAEYEDLARATRDMERRGTCGTALGTLRQARDDAERRWREAKPPAPLPRRLEWAEAKLHRAQAALSRERIELDRMDDEYEARRAEQCRRIAEAESWYAWRKQQLEQVHQEAAGLASGGGGKGPAGGGAEQMSRRIRGQVLPEMQAIMEELQEGTNLRERMALLVAGLADAEAHLGARAEDEGAAHYEMYEGDSHDGGWEDHHQGCADGDGDDRMDNCDGCGGDTGRPANWRPEGPGRWSKAGTTQARAGLDGNTTQQTSPQRSDVRGGDGGAATAADGAERANGGVAARRSDGDDDTGERAGKHRRREAGAEDAEAMRVEDDARRAQELRRQIDDAAAAQTRSYQEGRGGFGSEAALSAAARRFVLDVQRAQAQANEMGIEPRTSDGRPLLELSPAELGKWVEEHLEGGRMQD